MGGDGRVGKKRLGIPKNFEIHLLGSSRLRLLYMPI